MEGEAEVTCLLVLWLVKWDNTKMQKKILLQLLAVMCTWQRPGCLCTKQAQWAVQAKLGSLARKIQTFPHSKWCGHLKSHLDPAVSWEKALNLHPSKCQVPNHSWVDWWGWWEADGKSDGKIARVGLELGDLRPQAKDTTTTPHTHTHTHTHTHWHTQWTRVN